MLAESIISITQYATVIANILFIVILIIVLFNIPKTAKLKSLMYKHARLSALVVAITALLGSLSYSEIVGYAPCRLCWIQRIFMFPLTVILGIAYFVKDKGIEKYVISLASLGAIVAGFHYYTQMFQVTAICLPGEETCTRIWEFAFGYVTIPFMALSAFALIILFSIIEVKKRHKK